MQLTKERKRERKRKIANEKKKQTRKKRTQKLYDEGKKPHKNGENLM